MTRTHNLAAVLLVVPVIAIGAAPSLLVDDAALLAHIKKTDYIFTTALGNCSEEKIIRTTAERERRFEFTALCAARAAQESDCPAYRVRATGTVDTASWATVRFMTLTLQCRG